MVGNRQPRVPLHVRYGTRSERPASETVRFHCEAFSEDVRSAPGPPMHPQPAERTRRGPSNASLRRLEDNLTAIRNRMEAARTHGSRGSPGPVTLVAVTKAAPPGGIELLAQIGRGIGDGVIDVGENRVLDAAAKRAAGPRNLRWHGIGHLQTNKARKAVETFEVFHALDSLHLADRLEAILAEGGRSLPVYVQVNAARDPAKSGISCEEAAAFLRALADRPHLDVVGWMTMARDVGASGGRPSASRDARTIEEGDAASTRSAFAALRAVRDDVVKSGIGRVPAAGLSMGMSDDFEIAVEEGATCVRIGRAIWAGIEPVASGDVAAGDETAPSVPRAMPRRGRT